jgi:hypothetical protein
LPGGTGPGRRLRALDEQRHCRRLVERRNRQLVLGAHPQSRPARHEGLQARAPFQQLGQRRHRTQQMLEVVQHQEQPAGLAVPGHAGQGRLVLGLTQPQRPRHNAHHEVVVAERPQGDDRYTVPVLAAQLGGEF